MAEEAPRTKRSRFDQTEPDPPRKTRFDRRSQSPVARERKDRSRSPLKSTESPGDDAMKAAAAAAAAKINAALAMKAPVHASEVPIIRQRTDGDVRSPSAGETSGTLNNDIYQQDGDYIKDIEVNDLRNRYTLTKGATQKMPFYIIQFVTIETIIVTRRIKDETGADVTTRGNYYPDKSMATPAKPPLYLHVTSQTKEGLEKAIEKINELMKQDLPDLIDQRRFRRPEREERPQHELDSRGRRKWPEERIPIDLEPIPGFNLRANVVGYQGANVKYIQAETRCRVQIKGYGSGFIEHDTGAESEEPMYLHVTSPDEAMVAKAKELCLELLTSIHAAYKEFKERGPQNSGGDRGGYRGPRGDRGDRQNNGSYGNRNGSDYGGNYQQGGYGATQGYQGYGAQGYGNGGAGSPDAAAAAASQTPADPAEAQRQYEAWCAYYAQNPSADPYIAYGGYAAVMSQYQQQQQQQSATPAPTAATPTYPAYGAVPGQAQSPVNAGYAAPGSAPPQDNGIPPPPPPPPAEPQGYHAVPPPPPPPGA